jgi:Sulfotransferase domain
MVASDFVSPPRPPFPAWLRYASYAPLYGLALPTVKLLQLCGNWPSKGMQKRLRGSMGDFGDYRPDANDVLVCSYFKSGTNWLLQTCVQIAYRGEAEFDHIHCVVPWPDAPAQYSRPIIPLHHPSPRQRAPSGLHVIKTHRDRTRIPFGPEAHYVAMVRDPKDVCVSAYHFLKTMVFGPLMPAVERFVDGFLAPDYVHGSWAVHLASYWSVRDQPNVLFLTYEEMLRDSAKGTARIAKFLGVDLSPDQFESVLRHASFAAMKREVRKFEPPPLLPWSGQDFMVRKGVSGKSSELLSAVQQQRIDDHFRSELKRLDCDFPYDEAFAARH